MRIPHAHAPQEEDDVGGAADETKGIEGIANDLSNGPCKRHHGKALPVAQHAGRCVDHSPDQHHAREHLVGTRVGMSMMKMMMMLMTTYLSGSGANR